MLIKEAANALSNTARYTTSYIKGLCGANFI
jgi:hypothetical protein